MKDSKFQVGDWVSVDSAPDMKAHITAITAEECSVGVQYYYFGRLYIKSQFSDKKWGFASGKALVRFSEIELKRFQEEKDLS